MTEAAAEEFDVIPIFVWQPVPTYGYDLKHHLFTEENQSVFAGHDALRFGYNLMDEMRDVATELEPSGDFLWLADIQYAKREPLYVDAAHYTAAFSREIADLIAEEVATTLSCCQQAGRYPE